MQHHHPPKGKAMNDGYQTVFEVSYFSNGSLLMSLVFLSVGIVAVVAVARSWKSGKMSPHQKFLFVALWAPIWFLVSGLWIYSTISSGKEWTAALANNQCQVVEGTVQ